MPRSARALALAGLFVCAAAGTAHGQSGVLFNRPGSGARAAGMANAFIGISDDGTAASWNPAGLGQLRKPEISIVSYTSRRSGSLEGFRDRDESGRYGPMPSVFVGTALEFASLAVPVTIFGRPVTFQGAWRRLYALEYRENVATSREPLADATVVPSVIRIQSDVVGSIDVWSAAAAVKATRRLSLGASFNVWRGDWLQNAAFNEIPLGGTPLFRNIRERTEVQGNNVSTGVMLTYPRWSLGLVYQTPLKSDFLVNSVMTTSVPAVAFEGGVDGTLRFSRAFGVGTAWRPAPVWTVAADATWDDWTGATLDLPGEPELLSVFDNLPERRSATRDTLSFNAGAERLFHGEGYIVPLRFGAAWEPQGGRNPYTRDAVNWMMLAVGTGYNTNSLKFDAALQYRWTRFDEGGHFTAAVPAPTPELPTAVGERSWKEWRFKVSVILRLSDTDKLGGALGKVFGDGP